MAPLTREKADKYGVVVQVVKTIITDFKELKNQNLKHSGERKKRNGFPQKLKHPIDFMDRFPSQMPLFLLLYTTQHTATFKHC